MNFIKTLMINSRIVPTFTAPVSLKHQKVECMVDTKYPDPKCLVPWE